MCRTELLFSYISFWIFACYFPFFPRELYPCHTAVYPRHPYYVLVKPTKSVSQTVIQPSQPPLWVFIMIPEMLLFCSEERWLVSAVLSAQLVRAEEITMFGLKYANWILKVFIFVSGVLPNGSSSSSCDSLPFFHFQSAAAVLSIYLTTTIWF